MEQTRLPVPTSQFFCRLTAHAGQAYASWNVSILHRFRKVANGVAAGKNDPVEFIQPLNDGLSLCGIGDATELDHRQFNRRGTRLPQSSAERMPGRERSHYNSPAA